MTVGSGREAPRHGVLLLLAVAIGARLLTFGNPVLHIDEEFYLTTAHRMWAGALPYVDIWDRKPFGLFLLYMPAGALPLRWATWAYQIMALAAVVATAWGIARLAIAAGWRRGAIPAAIAYILWLNMLGGMGGQAPVFYNLLMIAAVALAAPRGDARHPRPRHHRRRGLAALALVGLALQIKYSVVFEGVFLGLWLLAREWRAQRSPVALVGYGAALVTIALLPTALVFGGYAAIGQAQAWIFANIESIFGRNPDPVRVQVLNAGQLLLILSPLLAMAVATLRRPSDLPLLRLFLRLWLATAVIAVIIFGGWFDHYGLPVLVPATLCAAGWFDRSSYRAGAAILALAALAGTITIAINRRNRGTAAQLAALTAAIGRGAGCLYVYRGTPMAYYATGRCAASRYLFPSHLTRTRETGAIGVDQQAEIDRILRAAPAVIVIGKDFSGERHDGRALVIRAVAARYTLITRQPMGSDLLAVYRRR
jgi:hypothetical protein